MSPETAALARRLRKELQQDLRELETRILLAMSHEPDTLVSQAEVARRLGCSPRTLRRRVELGELPPPVRRGGRSYWRNDIIDNYIRPAGPDRNGRRAASKGRRRAGRR